MGNNSRNYIHWALIGMLLDGDSLQFLNNESLLENSIITWNGSTCKRWASTDRARCVYLFMQSENPEGTVNLKKSLGNIFICFLCITAIFI